MAKKLDKKVNPKSRAHVEMRPENPADFGTIFDTTNPASLINKLHGRLLEIITTLPKEYLQPSLEDLKKLFKYHPRKEINLVRHAFWFEYDRSVKAEEKMNISAISKGVYLDEGRFFAALSDPCNVAYMLIPVQSYKVATEGMHAFALDQMYQILALPNVDARGRPIPSLIGQKRQIFTMLDMRLKGGFIQKQQIHAITEHVAQKDVTQAQLPAPNIDDEIARLQEVLKPKALLKVREVVGDE